MRPAPAIPDGSVLTPRWYPIKSHPVRDAMFAAESRFIVGPAGRRSGKTEVAKRKGVLEAISNHLADGWCVFAAPTRDQAKRIYWEDLKRLVPDWIQAGDPKESELTINLIHGPQITVLGMDKPYRIEGRPVDWICLDEFANMKDETWDAHVRPALSTIGRPGKGMLIGVPEGRNHYYQKYKEALADTSGEWAAYHWISSDILPASEIESARREMDPLVFQQEYEGSFINFVGRAYYNFTAEANARERIEYNPRLPLVFAFDFNVNPGTAAVMQEQRYTGVDPKVADVFTGVVGEVHIARNSTTKYVCEKLEQDWQYHAGEVFVYGDASGGAGGSSQTEGSDWTQVAAHLRRTFGDRVSFFVPKANPTERARVNALNSRCLAADGLKRLLVDPYMAPHVVEDLEGVRTLEGGSGQIDKKATPRLTHLSDGIGYYLEREYSTEGKSPLEVQQI